MPDIVAGEVVQLTHLVRRITAPNAGPMTGPGTNTYIVGSEQLTVVDPGPADPSHVNAIIEACGSRLKWILATHTHRDHSPAAYLLAEKTGAAVMGKLLEVNDGFQDDSFAPIKVLEHNDCLTTDEYTLRAIHTPGHVENHLCYLLEEEGLLLTGDHIMQGSTVVIIPPHGDMKDYIDSLRLLLDYPLKSMGPGHGYVIDQPLPEIKGLIEHRLGREAKVAAKLSQLGECAIEQLVPAVYDDVNPSLHAVARYSLLSHLIKLEKDGTVKTSKDLWSLC